MSQVRGRRDASAGGGTGAGVAESSSGASSASVGLRGQLRGVGYDEGLAALAPVQRKADGEEAAPEAAKGPIRASVIQVSADIPDDKNYAFHNDALIGKGKSAGLKPGMLVVGDGGHKGMVKTLFPNRARCMFYGGLPPDTKMVTVHPDQGWSEDDWLAEKKKGEGEADKAKSTKHGKRERGGM